MNRLVSIAKSLAGPAILVAVLFAGWSFRKQLFPQQETADASDDKPAAKSTEKQTILEISEQARKNLSLTSKAARPQSYWRTVVIPGEVADRPGRHITRGWRGYRNSCVPRRHYAPWG